MPQDPPIEEFEIEEFPAEPDNRSMLGKGWDLISSPLWEGPSRGARALSGMMAEDRDKIVNAGMGGMQGDNSWLDTLRKLRAQSAGFAEGGVEGIGDLLSGFTSPVNLAMMLASGGSSAAARAGYQGAAKGLTAASRAASVPVAVHGATEVLGPDKSLQERGMGLLEVAGGVAGATQPTPRARVNPALAESVVAGERPVPVRPTGSRPRVATSAGVDPRLAAAEEVLKQHPNIMKSHTSPEDILSAAEFIDPDRMGLPASKPNPTVDPNEFARQVTGELPPAREWKPPSAAAMSSRSKSGPSVALLEEGDIQNNASGDSSASVEAMNRNKAMAGKGERFVVYDRSGKARPLIGTDAVDYIAKPGETYGIEGPQGFRTLDNKGGRAPVGGAPTGNPKASLETPTQLKARLASEGKPTPILEEEVGISRPTPKQAKLQADLAGAKPRFAIGADQYTPRFESDIDKALFIIAQSNPSKRDADYLRFAMAQLGINEGQARQLGSKLRTEIKGIVKEVGGGGDIDIPTLHKDLLKGGRTPELSDPVPGMGGKPPTPPVKPPKGGDDGGGMPPDEPDMDIVGGEHIGDIQNAKKSAIVEAFNLPRGLMASYDFSAPLRQGIGLIHKKEFWRALSPMMKAWASEDAFHASQKAIAERPLFRPRVGPGGKPLKSFAEDAGLKLGDLTDLSKREEAIMSTWAETGGGLPGYQKTIGRGVRMSNRAYTTFLNNLRADTFESLVKDSKVFGADARADLPLARALADFVNTASGRGSLGALENSAVALNTVLFSPRLIASRIQMMNPRNYIMGPTALRKEYLKSLLAIAAVGNTVTQLGRMAGGTVESDPASSDFGKLKIGNTRLDPWAGFQQYGVLFNRLLTGNYKSSTSGKETDLYNPKGPYDPTALGTIGRFAWGKSHPAVNFAIGLLNAQKELSGEKMNFTTMNPMDNAVTQRFIPIILQDLYELSQEEPELLPVMIPAAFGMGTQTYGAKQ